MTFHLVDFQNNKFEKVNGTQMRNEGKSLLLCSSTTTKKKITEHRENRITPRLNMS